MRFFVAIATLAFATIGLAAPAAQGVATTALAPNLSLAQTIAISRDDGNITTTTSDDPTDDCDDPNTMENRSSDGSPLLEDCLRIAHNIRNGGEWTVTAFQRQLASYKSCALGAEDNSGGVLQVGNLDLIDFINASKQFEWNGKVGSRGWMNCRALGDTANRRSNPGLFTLYNTNNNPQ
ncbi:hypothetical protein OQA88_8308 [Cercophora sp. LCS_1]